MAERYGQPATPRQKKSQGNKNLGLNFFPTSDLLILSLMAAAQWKPVSKCGCCPQVCSLEHTTERKNGKEIWRGKQKRSDRVL